MEEIFCREWNMEEIFRYGMEKIVGMEYGKIVFHSIPLHALLFTGRSRYSQARGVDTAQTHKKDNHLPSNVAILC